VRAYLAGACLAGRGLGLVRAAAGLGVTDLGMAGLGRVGLAGLGWVGLAGLGWVGLVAAAPAAKDAAERGARRVGGDRGPGGGGA
jgi:hypothetical protein